MTFSQWFANTYPDIELHEWQEKIIQDFLHNMLIHRAFARRSGKSFVVKILKEYVDKYGNEYRKENSV